MQRHPSPNYFIQKLSLAAQIETWPKRTYEQRVRAPKSPSLELEYPGLLICEAQEFAATLFIDRQDYKHTHVSPPTSYVTLNKWPNLSGCQHLIC